MLAGFAGYLATVVITVAGNIPLNERLERAGPVDRLTDLATVRRDFERPWIRRHTLRTLTGVVAFGCLCVALAVA